MIARRAREHQARAAGSRPRRGRGLAAIRSRLTAADTRLHVTARRVHERTAARFTALAGRLEMLSPLAVLARGYAVCWNEDRTAIIRQASAVAPGAVVRVTLHEGEIDCEVRSAHGSDIKDFESASAELEPSSEEEEGDLTLEKALELYERGVHCRVSPLQLEEAERRLEILNERGELKTGAPGDGLTPPDEGGKAR